MAKSITVKPSPKGSKVPKAMAKKVSQLGQRPNQKPHGAKNPPPGPGKPKGVK